MIYCLVFPFVSVLGLLRYIENIEISVRYLYIVSYRIAGGNIEFFDISVSNFLIYHLAEFSFIHSRLKNLQKQTNNEENLHILFILYSYLNTKSESFVMLTFVIRDLLWRLGHTL